ncbi:MAG: cupin domain-containing protein [Phycisphaeraceae bacterium]|nr:cupin domain-containing protein [Phycisphaeraceae bacterium]MCW5755005.1 cupin domain-containing protein [Phycisphaeraceae bacterium]
MLKMTQADLADRSGVSKAMICDVEADKKNPTIRILGQIASGLDCSISELLDLDDTPRFIPERRAQQLVLRDPENGMERRVLSTPMIRRGIEIIQYTYPPGAECGGFPPHHHGTFETAIVVKGRVRMEIGAESTELGEGDCVTYAADVTHSAWNVGEDDAVVIYVVDSTRTGRSKRMEAETQAEE